MVFDRGPWAEVGPAEVQAALRQAFRRWGRPQRLRVDNGAPWGSTGGLPTALALWVVGLGVGMVWNRPRRPRENAVVERGQGVGKQWTEPQTCVSVAQLQERFEVADRRQRESYPSIGGRSRLQAYPHRKHSGRSYQRQWEQAHWSLKKVLQFLAGYAVPRRVDHSGKVSLYDRGYWVGKKYEGQVVWVSLDASTRQWVVADAQGNELHRHAAREISRQRIISLSVARQR